MRLFEVGKMVFYEIVSAVIRRRSLLFPRAKKILLTPGCYYCTSLSFRARTVGPDTARFGVPNLFIKDNTAVFDKPL